MYVDFKITILKGDNMKPYYTLNEEDNKIILGLVNKCIELDLGNVNFEYCALNSQGKDIQFYLNEYRSYWELTVKTKIKYDCFETDIYKITDNEIEYDHSEND